MKINVDHVWLGPIECDGPFFVQAGHIGVEVFWEPATLTDPVQASLDVDGSTTTINLSTFTGEDADGEYLRAGSVIRFPFNKGQKVYLRAARECAVTLGVSNAVS